MSTLSPDSQGLPGLSPEAAVAATFDRFARFYDDDYRAYDDDLDMIAMLAEEAQGPVLELGCGTGRVLLSLAVAGHAATGVDGSPALLAVARSKLALTGLGDHISLVEGDLRTFALDRRDFGLAVCTSNTLMHLTDPDDQLAALRNAHGHLRHGGQLLIDPFNPDVVRLTAINGLQELADQWTDDRTGAQVFKWCVRTVDWQAQLQDTLFIYEEVLANGETRRTACPFQLRFLWRNEAELMLQAAGFGVEAVWGDFEGSDYDAAGDHLVLLARKE